MKSPIRKTSMKKQNQSILTSPILLIFAGDGNNHVVGGFGNDYIDAGVNEAVWRLAA